MRALELDPDHFYKVGSEPIHHPEKLYFSDYDIDSDSEDSEGDEYYEELIGHHQHEVYEHDNISNESSLGFSEEPLDNDIQFSINEDVQFKLETEDNYEGRDIDVGITMPDDFPAQSQPK